MDYMLMFNQPARELEREPDDAASAPYWESWKAYMGAIYGAGIVRAGHALHGPKLATTVRVVAGQRQVQDGPFADTKEFLGGYLVIEVPSLDEALTWAARAPSSFTGSTEVRPVQKVG